MLVAQISDPHVLAPGKLFHAPEKAAPPGAGPNWSRIDTAACLARAVVELNDLTPQPDVAVITGDLVEHGSAPEYEHLRGALGGARNAGLCHPRQPRCARGHARGVRPRKLPAARRVPPLCYRGIPVAHRGARHSHSRRAWRAFVRGAARLVRFGVGGRSRAADHDPHAPPALHHRHRAYGPLRAAGHRRFCRDRVPPSARSSASCAAICIARSTAALPARSREPRRARPIRSSSILSRRRRCNLPSSRQAASSIFGARTGLVSHTAMFGDWPGPYPFRCRQLSDFPDPWGRNLRIVCWRGHKSA